MIEETLKVAANTSATKLAGAIAGIVSKGNEASLISIGAGSLNQSVKAVIIANRMLAANGVSLSIHPGFLTLDLSAEAGGKSEITALKLKIIVDK
jgi:stage V sporulation protein S